MMTIKELDLNDDKSISFVKEIYTNSFPNSERRSTEEMLQLYESDPAFHILTAIDGDELVGFLTYWDLDEFIFAEHFAISDKFRNGGFGSKTFKAFLHNQHKPIILEVELPNTILAERRIGFYQRLKFKLWENVTYQQPPYDTAYLPVPMKLMTYGDIDLAHNLNSIREKIYNKVYKQ